MSGIGDKAWAATFGFVEFFDGQHVDLDEVGMAGLGVVGGQFCGIGFDLIRRVGVVADNDVAARNVLGVEPELVFFG